MTPKQSKWILRKYLFNTNWTDCVYSVIVSQIVKNPSLAGNEMEESATLICRQCKSVKPLSLKGVAFLEQKSGRKLNNISDIKEVGFKFWCSKCGSHDITVDDGNLEDPNNSTNNPPDPLKEMVTCPYDGARYEKGKLCPLFAGHKSVAAHRRKKKYREVFTHHDTK